MKLDTSQLNILRDEFDLRQGGLSMEEFISVMSKSLPRASAERLSDETVGSLRELFLQVDVNGDGTMEWDEFTGFCIDQGIAATAGHSSSAVPDQLYSERTKWEDKTRTFASAVTRVDWIPELEKVFVSESACTSVKVFDPDRGTRGPLLLHEINLENAKSANRHDTAGAHKDRVKLRGNNSGNAATEMVVPICVEYVPELSMLIIAMSDLAVSFWDTTAYRRDPDGAVPWFVKRVHTEKLVLKMSWCAPYNILFTSGPQATGEIYAWKVSVEGHGAELRMRKLGVLKGHTDVVTDLLTVFEMRGSTLDFCALVSSSLDRCLRIWDPETLTLRAKRTGHKMGVKSLSMVGGGKNDGILCLSGGFDNEALLWEVRGMADKPLLRMLGHTAPVVHARMHSPGRIVTVDEFCTIKWWHLGSDFSDTSNYECIQTVLAYTGMGKRASAPVSMVCAGQNQRIMIAAKSLKVFDMVRVRPKSMPAVGVLYNRTSKTLATAAGRNVTVWSGTNGQADHVFHDCVDVKLAQDAQIAAFCLDFRHRKFVTADVAGSVSVFNYMNGALMKQNSAVHSKEISSICYADADRCVITASWDRSWKIMDEDSTEGGHAMPVLRTVHMSHDFDISSLCFSYTLNLVATGDSNGMVKVWDFQFSTYEGTCGNLDGTPTASGGDGAKGDEITCMQFLEPYPLLAVADFAGHVSVYSVRPWYASYRLVRRIDNLVTDNFGQSTKWPVTCMKYMYDPNGGESVFGGGGNGNGNGKGNDGSESSRATARNNQSHKSTNGKGEENKHTDNSNSGGQSGGIGSGADITTGRALLFCGDENGNVTVYDLMPVIQAAGITAIREKDMPTLRNNYYARRRASLFGNGLPSLEAMARTIEVSVETALADEDESQVMEPELEEPSLSSSSSPGAASVLSANVKSELGQLQHGNHKKGNRPRSVSKTTSELSEMSEMSTGSSVPSFSESVPSLPAIGGGNKKQRSHSNAVTANANTGGLASATQSLTASRLKRRGTKKGRGRRDKGGSRRMSTTAMKQKARVKQQRKDSLRVPLLLPEEAPGFAVVSQWCAHEGTIVTALDVNMTGDANNMVPFVLTSGEDLVIRAFSVEGVPFGFLTKGDEEDKRRGKPYPWTCLLDMEAQAAEQHLATIEARSSVILQEEKTAKIQAKAEKERQRAEANAALVNARLSPMSSTMGSPEGSPRGGSFFVSDDVAWQIENATKGTWETAEQRIIVALEIAHQEHLAAEIAAEEAACATADAEAKAEAEAEAVQAKADAEAKERGEKVFKRRKKTKQPRDVGAKNAGKNGDTGEAAPQKRIQLNVRGKRLLFHPHAMTIVWVGGGDDAPKNVRRTDSSATEIERKAQQERLDKDRDRVVGQLMGERTWKLSDLERGRMLAEQAEEQKRQVAMAAARKSKSAEERKDKEMQELLSDPVMSGKGSPAAANDEKPDHLPFDHPSNWLMGSTNRLKMLYPNWDGESNRTETKKEAKNKNKNKNKKIGGGRRSLFLEMPEAEDVDLEEDEKWLRSRLNLHSHLIEQLDIKKVRQTEAAQHAEQRLRDLLEAQKEAAIETRKRHERRMRKDKEYAAKINAGKKPAVPSHLVRKMGASSSAPSLVAEVLRPARQIRRTLKSSGAMPAKIKEVSTLKNRLKFIMRDLEKDINEALSPKKKNKKNKNKGRGKSRGRSQSRGGSFEETEEDKKARLEEEEIKALRRAERKAALKRKLHFGTYNKEQLLHMRARFKKMDKDGSGQIDLDEFLLSEEDSHMSDHMASMFHAMDQDGDGNVSFLFVLAFVFYFLFFVFVLFGFLGGLMACFVCLACVRWR